MFKLELGSSGQGKSGLLKSKREIYLLTIFILVIFLRFFIPKDIQKIKSASLENMSKQEELNRKKTEFFTTESLIKDKEKLEEKYLQTMKYSEFLDKKIEELKNALVKREKIAEILNYLTVSPASEHLEFNLITMDPMIEYEKYDVLTVKMKMNANYFSFMSYMKNLETLPFLLEVKKLTINSPEADGNIFAEAELAIYVSK
ncbi:MAG: type 4a pilus biogenesis protein PilO [Candidatus Omnitrophota bacterium]